MSDPRHIQKARGDGTTTRQMQDAPKGAVFVWPASHTVGYAMDLARHLGRLDLAIVTPGSAHTQFGTRPPAVIFDHAFEWPGRHPEDYRDLERLRGMVRP